LHGDDSDDDEEFIKAVKRSGIAGVSLDVKAWRSDAGTGATEDGI
jgi:hypothetical protein